MSLLCSLRLQVSLFFFFVIKFGIASIRVSRYCKRRGGAEIKSEIGESIQMEVRHICGNFINFCEHDI